MKFLTQSDLVVWCVCGTFMINVHTHAVNQEPPISNVKLAAVLPISTSQTLIEFSVFTFPNLKSVELNLTMSTISGILELRLTLLISVLSQCTLAFRPQPGTTWKLLHLQNFSVCSTRLAKPTTALANECSELFSALPMMTSKSFKGSVASPTNLHSLATLGTPVINEKLIKNNMQN